MRKPDGSHDQLDEQQAAAVDMILKRDGLWAQTESINTRRGGLTVVFLFLTALTGLTILLWALLILPVDQSGIPADPYFVTTTPTTYGPPGPTGGPIR